MIDQYDIVVIGGGIHGAGVAQAAATRGYSTLVLEKNEIASGTSSRSSKLIHGGLRYLENMNLSLVKECLNERKILLDNAPDLVKLVPFYIPVYRKSRRTPLTIRVGLSLYALLGGLKKSNRFKKIKKAEWPVLDGIRTDDLVAVYQYFDGQTDDQKLTSSVMRSAEKFGAKIFTNTKLLSGKRTNLGYSIFYERDNEIFSCETKTVVNAAGPWINHVLSKFEPKLPPQSVELIQGTHIIFPGQINKGIYYVESITDKRVIFVIPWYGQIMAGTTETPFTGTPDDVTPLKEEIDYLIKTVSFYFPKIIIEPDSVQAFAGLRVLPTSKPNALSFSQPRETNYQKDDKKNPRLISIVGGKLTAYRATAEKTVDLLQHNLPKRSASTDTQYIKLKQS